jgi:hypothetical protein
VIAADIEQAHGIQLLFRFPLQRIQPGIELRYVRLLVLQFAVDHSNP